MKIDNIKARLLQDFSDAKIAIKDLTGTGDHLEINITSDLFLKKSLVEQHQMVYKSLGTWVGKEIHAVVIKTSSFKN
jgi:stress-induced morphogen